MADPLMKRAIEEWYRRETPRNPRCRAEVIAEEFGIDGAALHEACQADLNRGADSFADPAHD